jgi:hypothetical protein
MLMLTDRRRHHQGPIRGGRLAQRQIVAPGRGDLAGAITVAGWVPADAAGISLARRLAYLFSVH